MQCCQIFTSHAIYHIDMISSRDPKLMVVASLLLLLPTRRRGGLFIWHQLSGQRKKIYEISFLSRPTNYLHGRFSLPNRCSFNMCRVSHLLSHLGWVDFDSCVPPSCPAVQPLLPNSQQPGQNWADSGTLQIQVSQTQVNELMGRPVQTSLHCSSSEEADDPRPEGPPPPLQAGALQGRGRGRRHVQDERR